MDNNEIMVRNNGVSAALHFQNEGGDVLIGRRIQASGPLEQVITDENLSETFDMRISVENHDGRFAARAV